MPWVQTACREPCWDPPIRQTSVQLSLPLEQEGCSSNLNNCCQGFGGDSLVSETGSLVSRGLSGEQPPPPCVAKTPPPEGLSASPSAHPSHLLFSKTLTLGWQSSSVHLGLCGRRRGCMYTGACCVHPEKALLWQPGSYVLALCFNRDGGRGHFAGPPSILWVSLYRFVTGMSFAF